MKQLVAIILLAFVSTVLATAQNSAWDYSTKTDISGRATEFAVSVQASGPETHDSLILRCKASCEAYLHVGRGIAADQSYVQIKFNDGPVRRFSVHRGEGSDSLFFSDAVGLMNAIKQNGGYMTVEYSPYQMVPVMVKFGVWNLPPSFLDRVTKGMATRQKVERDRAAEERRREAKEATEEAEEHKRFCEKLKSWCASTGDGQNCPAWDAQCAK